MKKNFYAFLLTPLLFVGCNTPEVSAPTSSVSQTESSVVDTQSTGSTTNIKYVNTPIVIKEGMLHIDTFTGTLKPTLKSALQQDKTQEIAMGTCSSIAMKMTNDYNNISPKVKVRRTALKYRNPANKPDATDKQVMYRFLALNDGKPVAIDMGDKYRVYKPLKTKAKCLLCHGDVTQMSPKVVEMIRKKYPHDLATGFKLGEFRGAVVAEFNK